MSKFEDFAKLHVPGDPLVLFNAWDAGSAAAVAKSGAKAIATGSASVSMANGFGDGQEVPLDLALANAVRIVKSVELPVTVDFEGGYATDRGAADRQWPAPRRDRRDRLQFEDQVVGTDRLYDVDDQVARIAALRAGVGDDFFINAAHRSVPESARRDARSRLADEAIERGKAYAEAGANGFFIPGLADLSLVERINQAVGASGQCHASAQRAEPRRVGKRRNRARKPRAVPLHGDAGVADGAGAGGARLGAAEAATTAGAARTSAPSCGTAARRRAGSARPTTPATGSRRSAATARAAAPRGRASPSARTGGKPRRQGPRPSPAAPTAVAAKPKISTCAEGHRHRQGLHFARGRRLRADGQEGRAEQQIVHREIDDAEREEAGPADRRRRQRRDAAVLDQLDEQRARRRSRPRGRGPTRPASRTACRRTSRRSELPRRSPR